MRHRILKLLDMPGIDSVTAVRRKVAENAEHCVVVDGNEDHGACQQKQECRQQTGCACSADRQHSDECHEKDQSSAEIRLQHQKEHGKEGDSEHEQDSAGFEFPAFRRKNAQIKQKDYFGEFRRLNAE